MCISVNPRRHPSRPASLIPEAILQAEQPRWESPGDEPRLIDVVDRPESILPLLRAPKEIRHSGTRGAAQLDGLAVQHRPQTVRGPGGIPAALVAGENVQPHEPVTDPDCSAFVLGDERRGPPSRSRPGDKPPVKLPSSGIEDGGSPEHRLPLPVETEQGLEGGLIHLFGGDPSERNPLVEQLPGMRTDAFARLPGSSEGLTLIRDHEPGTSSSVQKLPPIGNEPRPRLGVKVPKEQWAPSRTRVDPRADVLHPMRHDWPATVIRRTRPSTEVRPDAHREREAR